MTTDLFSTNALKELGTTAMKSGSKPNRKIPKVRIARPATRPFQLRYTCPVLKREIRITIGCRDEDEAERLKKELEAKLVLGLSTSLGKDVVLGPKMEWSDFREQFRVLHLTTLRDNTSQHAESRLDIAERILRPKTLADIAEPNTLQQLQAKLLAGSHSRRSKPRSSHTVRGYMSAVMAALNWAYLQGWLPSAPKVRKIKTSKQKSMKGRPISADEFQRMLDATPKVVGEEAAESWRFVLKGLWASALRLDELMHVSWDKPGAIRPVWKSGQFPILEIPAAMQKNDTEENVPLLPWLDTLIQVTPPENRTGWVFNPRSMQLKAGRKAGHQRLDAEWVGKIIARIGKEAGVEVEPGDDRTGRPIKYASAHDLRRACGDRLRDAGIPPLVICRVMRHSSWETTRKHYAPGSIQVDAKVLSQILNPPAS